MTNIRENEWAGAAATATGPDGAKGETPATDHSANATTAPEAVQPAGGSFDGAAILRDWQQGSVCSNFLDWMMSPDELASQLSTAMHPPRYAHLALETGLGEIKTVGMSADNAAGRVELKGTLREQALLDWLTPTTNNMSAVTTKSWAIVGPVRIGAGAIDPLAMEKRWRLVPNLVLDGCRQASPGEHPAAAFPASQPACPAPILASGPSFTPMDPGGLVGDLARYMIDTARRPQPLLAVGASLCALGALMGQRYRTMTNLRTNLYIVGIADSGSGKNHAREIVNELFFEAGLSDHLGGNKIASGAGLLTALHRQPALLLQIDEFGMFLSAAADRKRSPRHITEILDNMTELYTAAGGIFLGAEYANRDGLNERRDIVQPCLCVYGTTTPQHFWGALQGANVVDGSLARFIILPTEEDYPDENRTAGLRQTPPALIEGLQRLAEVGGGASIDQTPGPGTAAQLTTVPMDKEAQARFDALGDEITVELRTAAGTPHTPILARIAENAAKVALIVAVGRDAVQPVIRLEDATWAIDFIWHFARRTMDAVERHVADTQTEADLKRVREIIRKAGSAGITKSKLTRATQWLKVRDREDILFTLNESGDITIVEKSTGGRNATLYRALR